MTIKRRLNSPLPATFSLRCFLSCMALSIAPLYSTYAEKPWGCDSDLTQEAIAKKMPAHKAVKNPFVLFGKAMVGFHQKVLHPIQGERSHFRPTSSHYTLQAIKAHGFFKGFIMGCDRLMRENEEAWIYPTRIIHGRKWKWDPPKGAPFSDYKRPETLPADPIDFYSKSD